MISQKSFRFVTIVFAPALLVSCGGKINVVEPTHVAVKTGCTRPAVVGVAEQKSIEIASIAIKGIQSGGFSYKKNPKVFSAFSKSSKDHLIIEYQVCLARWRYKYTNVQAEWLRNKLNFMRVKPTAVELDKWQKEHPFPGAGNTGSSAGNRKVKQTTTGDNSSNSYNSNVKYTIHK